MKNLRHFAQKYVDWVIKLGRLKFSLIGLFAISILAVGTHILMNLLIVGNIDWLNVMQAVVFGLISAPFVIYFFTLLVEKLERSRQSLAQSVNNLQLEIQERISAEKRLAQANRDKSTLMATISHELRTPLNGIVGLSRMLLDTQLSEEQRNYLNTINVSAVSLGHIFNDIIDLEKIDSSRIELFLRETHFPSFLNDLNNISHLMAEQKRLKFEMNYRGDLPEWLLLDSTRLSQIIWNLISNAVKFTDQGKISLHIERVDSAFLRFTVQDTGLGIPAQDLDKIFAMYYQVDLSQNKYKLAGSGIGLSVSKNIAKLMGGDLTVKSELGKGSCFSLIIQAQDVKKQESLSSMQNVSGLSILLVEDIELNIIVARSVLQKLGHQVDVATTGKQAIQLFEQNDYDLVLLDIQLPDMTGFDIAEHLREKYQQGVYDYLPPLIALTANVIHNKAEYQQKGMDDVLRKPLALDELHGCLMEYFGELIELPESKIPEFIEQENTAFDLPMLNELIEILGADFVLGNLSLFEQTMPTYLQALRQSYQRYLQDPANKQPVASNAHKIKGAAASIGLKRLQQIAALAQNPAGENWEQQIGYWLIQLEQSWQQDVLQLSKWLEKMKSYTAKNSLNVT